MNNETHPQNVIELDGEALARAYPNPTRFKRLVEILRRNGATDADIVKAMARAKTIVSP